VKWEGKKRKSPSKGRKGWLMGREWPPEGGAKRKEAEGKSKGRKKIHENLARNKKRKSEVSMGERKTQENIKQEAGKNVTNLQRKRAQLEWLPTRKKTAKRAEKRKNLQESLMGEKKTTGGVF